MVEIFHNVSGHIDTTTLAARTALLVHTIFSDVPRNFMLKNLRHEISVIAPDSADFCLLVLAAADASVGEIAGGMLNTSRDLEDSVAYKDGQADVRRIWDFHIVKSNMASTIVTSYMHQWKLPPKGLPLLRGHGLAVFAFNMSIDNSFVNGPVIVMQSKAMGGWF